MKYRPTKNIFLLSLISFFNDLSSEMIFSIFPAFFVSVLKSGAGALGFMEGIADGLSNVIKIFSGRFSDLSRGRKRFIFWGYTLSVLTRPFFIFISTISGAIGLRVVDRIGKGLRDSPRDALISLSTPKAQIGRAFGYHRMWDTLGAILGPFLAYLILSRYPDNFNLVFLSSFVIGVLAVISVFFVKDVAGFFKANGSFSINVVAGLSGEFKRYLVSLLFLSFGSLPVSILLLKTQHLGLKLASIPLFYMLYNLSFASFSLFAGKMSDRFGSRAALLFGYLALLSGYILLFFTKESTVLLGVDFILLGLFPAFTDGVQRALASQLSAEEHRGGAIGLVNATIGIGLLLAGIVGGSVWQYLGAGYSFLFAIMSILVGLSTLFLGSSRAS